MHSSAHGSGVWNTALGPGYYDSHMVLDARSIIQPGFYGPGRLDDMATRDGVWSFDFLIALSNTKDGGE